MSPSITGMVGLDLQGIAVLLGGVSAYYIWRQVTTPDAAARQARR